MRGDRKNGKSAVDKVLENRAKELPSSALSTVERMKVLDEDFRAQTEGAQQHYFEIATARLAAVVRDMDSIREALMARLRTGEHKISVRDLTGVLDSMRRWANDISEQLALAHGKPTSIHGHLHANLCPRCAKAQNMSEAELDGKIAELEGHIANSHKGRG